MCWGAGISTCVCLRVSEIWIDVGLGDANVFEDGLQAALWTVDAWGVVFF